MEIKAAISRITSSYKTSIVLLLIYAVGLAFATLFEKHFGTLAAKMMFYYSPLFLLLQFFLVVNLVSVTIKYRLYKTSSWGFIVTHAAFIIILAGALTTHLFSEEGTIHIRENETSDRMLIQTNRGDNFHTLPFSLELKKFTLTRYPGSSSPSSFESTLIIHVDGKSEERKVSMNNILDIKGYRLFQASYDTDEMGTILSVNKDVAGRNITYTGYCMLVIGFILCFVRKDSRLRQLSRHLKQLRNAPTLIILTFILSTISLSANTHKDSSNIVDVLQKNKASAEHAALFGALPMQSRDGRMEPINTFSSEILRKLHSSNKMGELNSDQFLISLLTFSEMWIHVPFISNKNNDIAAYYKLTEKELAYIELFDENGNYKLQDKLEEAFNKPQNMRNKFDKDLIKLDERVNIFHQLVNFKMLNIFPKENDPNHKWYSPGDDLSEFPTKDSVFVSNAMTQYLRNVQTGLQTADWEKAEEMLIKINIYQQEKSNTLEINQKKIKAEVTYNNLDIFRLCKKFYLILGGILLAISFTSFFRKQKWITWAIRFLTAAIAICLLFHIFGMGMRWYIAGYAPWSNSYETMIYVSSICVLGGLVFVRQNPIIFALATLFGGIILFVSGLNWMDPQISPLVPVLKSPWLMIHVAVIVAAYGFFGISFLLGITNTVMLLIQKKNKSSVLSNNIQEFSIVNEMSLLIGIALMTIGTFLGAVWANESWGRYWGWDPKETWALITIVVYAIVTHLRLIKQWDKLWLFNLLSAIAFLTVLMTYFGVNYYLSGMHSYG
ncbi:cytochrome c biogenesis protein CcsA [Dysgonomonas sp. ZJ709]|uniref:cytochrome c biogenesis protein CcsA n=1 Tax=Dysgonomonas sp. ZJ709 TaxID=2709797 RepID=UPI0013ECAFD2|nr:cytochrome c biogenesis protein CcsA [Dysgonomonas sp. ZJ709]